MSNYNKQNGAKASRRYLNLHEEGDSGRTMVFQLCLSGILSSESYIPSCFIEWYQNPDIS
jgi:hypothetical protein